MKASPRGRFLLVPILVVDDEADSVEHADWVSAHR